MSQICNQKESEYLAYDYMKEQYQLLANEKMLREFSEYPIRQSEEMYKNIFLPLFVIQPCMIWVWEQHII